MSKKSIPPSKERIEDLGKIKKDLTLRKDSCEYKREELRKKQERNAKRKRT